MHMDFESLRLADRRAVEATLHVLDGVTVADLDRPTPCGDWDLAELLAHLTVQQHGFARAAGGGSSELADWHPKPLGERAVAAYRDASAEVLAAFAEPNLAAQSFLLPEIRDGGPFRAELAVGFHVLDNLVHAWDLATALDCELVLDDDLGTLALRLAQTVPNGPERSEPGAAFAPALGAPADADDFERALLLLGRKPR